MITHSRDSRNTALRKNASKGEDLLLVSACPSFHKDTHLPELLRYPTLGPVTSQGGVHVLNSAPLPPPRTKPYLSYVLLLAALLTDWDLHRLEI